jgi:hypothetical protein
MKNDGFRKFFAVAASEREATPTFAQQLQGFSLTHAFQTNPVPPMLASARRRAVARTERDSAADAEAGLRPVARRREPDAGWVLRAVLPEHTLPGAPSARNAAFLPWSGHKTRKGGNPQ